MHIDLLTCAEIFAEARWPNKAMQFTENPFIAISQYQLMACQTCFELHMHSVCAHGLNIHLYSIAVFSQ